MMFKKIREIVKTIKNNKSLAEELLWSSIYHDAVKATWADNQPLNVGRWAGNYSFFYVLFRILNDYKPKNIIEFGLGESTKMITKYVASNEDFEKHLIIEQDQDWKATYLSNTILHDKSKIEVLPIIQKKYKEGTYNSYSDIEKLEVSNFNFYLIDGPFGSQSYSRFDIYALLKENSLQEDFIILFDDYDRIGEKQTVKEVLELLKSKNIEVFTKSYSGIKSVFVIATKKYKYATSF